MAPKALFEKVSIAVIPSLLPRKSQGKLNGDTFLIDAR